MVSLLDFEDPYLRCPVTMSSDRFYISQQRGICVSSVSIRLNEANTYSPALPSYLDVSFEYKTLAKVTYSQAACTSSAPCSQTMRRRGTSAQTPFAPMALAMCACVRFGGTSFYA